MLSVEAHGPIPGLDRCAEEQIQIIGHIQPHGLLFALSEPDLLVKQVSTNVATFLGVDPQSVLDRSFEAVLGAQQFEVFRTQWITGQESSAATLRLPVRDGVLEMECIAHRQDGVLIVELEPSQGGHSLGPLQFDAHIRIPLLRLRAASDIQELSRLAASELRRLSGFARVMIYRFDKSWNGEVIAESVGSSPISYFGMRFPASDIPLQVRQLFLLNPIRAIVDVDATPASILPTINPLTEKVLDLTLSALRSPSPIHLEYLRNMGVQSSLTISIVVEGRLWGLVACHHDKAHRLALSTRSICEFIGGTLAAQVATRSDNASLQSRLKARTKRDEVAAGIAASKSLVEAVHSQGMRLLDLFDADALVSRIEGVGTSHGAGVPTELLRGVIGKLRNLASRSVASCHELSQLDPDLAPYASLVSGALYIDLAETGSTEGSGDYLLFLRRELVETISWAGNPNKSVVADRHDRLHPRKSFEAWQETVRRTSCPWTETELESGLILREQMRRLGDIVARRRAEEVRERLAAIVESSDDAIITKTLDGTISAWNHGAEKVFGYSAAEIVGKPMLVLLPPERIDEESDILARIKRGESVDHFETVRVRKNGAKIDVSVTISPIRDSNGAIIGASKVARDITERTLKEEALRESEERFQTIANGIPQLAWMAEADGSIFWYNQRWYDYTGTTLEQTKGWGWEKLHDPAYLPRVLDRWKEAIAAGTRFDMEFPLRGADGRFRMFLTRGMPVRNSEGRVVRWLGTNTDSTDSDARYRGLLEAAPDAMVVVNQDGEILLLNVQAEKEFGYQRDELLGQKITRIVPEGFAERLAADGTRPRAEALARQMNMRIELSGRCKDGSRFPVEIMLSPLESAEGILITAAIRNISARNKLERDKANLMDQAAVLLASHTELERRVNERTLELAASNQILERSNIELKQFAYIASHDLQSPLRSISGFVQLLKMKYGGKLDDQASDWIRRTLLAIGQMQALIKDLLDYSRVESRLRPFVPTAFLDVFNDTVGLLASSIGNVGGQVTCGPLPVITGDRSQLVQLLDNLIANGLKYNIDETPRVHVSAEQVRNEWIFSVRDNGIGIAPEYGERIFEIFQRLHDQTDYPGTGIGLALCRRIVNGHGGRIWVDSEPGHGSTFHFTIPAGTDTPIGQTEQPTAGGNVVEVDSSAGAGSSIIKR